MKVVIDQHLFCEDVFEQMKKTAKIKFLHIGLRMVDLIMQRLSAEEVPLQTVAKFVEFSFCETSNYRSVLIRNIQMPKNQLHDVARESKNRLLGLLERITKNKGEGHGALGMKMLRGLFGPNSTSHFSPKKQHDILQLVSKLVSTEHVSEYLEVYLTKLLENPNLPELFP